jgi:hypothetical protein
LDGRSFVGGPNKGKGGVRVELLLKIQISKLEAILLLIRELFLIVEFN